MTLENSEKFEEIRVHRVSTFIAKLGRNFISRMVFLARGSWFLVRYFVVEGIRDV